MNLDKMLAAAAALFVQHTADARAQEATPPPTEPLAAGTVSFEDEAAQLAAASERHYDFSESAPEILMAPLEIRPRFQVNQELVARIGRVDVGFFEGETSGEEIVGIRIQAGTPSETEIEENYERKSR